MNGRYFLFFSVLLMMLFCSGGCGNSLEDNAEHVMTDIARSRFGKDVRCTEVIILKSISSGVYKARAILSNGDDILITVEDRGDHIFVDVPLVQ